MLRTAYDEVDMKKYVLFEWYKSFKEGREEMEDDGVVMWMKVPANIFPIYWCIFHTSRYLWTTLKRIVISDITVPVRWFKTQPMNHIMILTLIILTRSEFSSHSRHYRWLNDIHSFISLLHSFILIKLFVHLFVFTNKYE